MKQKIKANVVQQVHWDPEWYFTEEDTTVQFAYNTKDLIDALEEGRLKQFFLDGRTDALEDYLLSHQEDRKRVEKLVQENKLFIGPFHAQLDCFISSGEAIFNNLRIGMELGDKYGGTSKLAWLPDSFGHTQDFPKIFSSMGINDFIFRRGMGEEHNLPIDFYWESNDGSKVLTNVLQCGYGFATPAFVSGKLTDEKAENYQGKDLNNEFRSLAKWSTLDNEFLLPIGFDLNPTIDDFQELIDKYNKESDEFEFEEITFHEYMDKLREESKDFKSYKGEFMSAQHHRMHRSLFSARADIKALQDKVERIMTYEVQPLMTMIDNLGLEYDKGLIDRAWDLLVRSQTHSSATNTDKTNELIKVRSARAYNIAESCKVYLIRKIAATIPKEENKMPIVIYNTLPEKRDMCTKLYVYSRSKDFKLELNGEEVEYSVIDVDRMFSGIYRKDASLMKEEDYFYRTEISINIKDFNGFSYKTLYLLDGEKANKITITEEVCDTIENSRYKISFVDDKFNIYDKKYDILHKDSIYIEESGDEGDNYDHSYPDKDLILKYDFKDAKINRAYNTKNVSELEIEGKVLVPYNLQERAEGKVTTKLGYKLKFRLREDRNVIEVSGNFDNKSLNHRVRLVVRTENESKYSYAGTQFGYIKRETLPENLESWRAQKYDGEPIESSSWLEEPTPTYPLLNYVSLLGNKYVATAYTRGSKEYEIIGENYSDIALTIFRGVGHLGLPDLNRRPGRASGLQEKLFETPLSQMLGDNQFEFGFEYSDKFDGNKIGKEYVKYATDQSYFQNQRLERVVFPMCFLDTAALSQGVPEEFKLLELQDSEATFGTLKKANEGNAYVLRVFNNENHEVDGGTLKINVDYKEIRFTNGAEDVDIDGSLELGNLRPGEIINVKIIL
ncbi:hypothetical protein [Clostridium oceanicum]|uniref:Mannosylglycerate hydrolase n=1 Tax=Clostridium oceanicum TaxID=1543 RepID=A0ABP3UK69_9CLOT